MGYSVNALHFTTDGKNHLRYSQGRHTFSLRWESGKQSVHTSPLLLLLQQLLSQLFDIVPQFGILHHQLLLLSDAGLDNCSEEFLLLFSTGIKFDYPTGHSRNGLCTNTETLLTII